MLLFKQDYIWHGCHKSDLLRQVQVGLGIGWGHWVASGGSSYVASYTPLTPEMTMSGGAPSGLQFKTILEFTAKNILVL